METFTFWSKFLSFKGVSTRKKWRNPKKIDILNFNGNREVLIKLYQHERCAKFWVLIEILTFWSKFLRFKGVSPRKKWRNPKINLRS